MNDQYRNPIPADLTLLIGEEMAVSTLTPEQCQAINSLDWYCFGGNRTGYIFVSQSRLEEILDGLIDNISPDECNPHLEVVKIDAPLHRYNNIDGWYWA